MLATWVKFRCLVVILVHFLDHVLTNWISNSDVGQAVYSPMCDENGGRYR